MNREEISQLSYDCVLPSSIFFNDNLEPNCIKLYAMVRNLSKMHGYCFATNEYLADLMASDISSVKRWLSSLKDEGYLEIHTNKTGIHWSRELYLSDKFKKSLRRLKNEPPPAQNSAPPSSKMSHIKEGSSEVEEVVEEKKKEKKKEEEGAKRPPNPPIPLFQKGEVSMSQESYLHLVNTHGRELVDETIHQLDLYAKIDPRKFKRYQSHSAVVEAWVLKEKKKPQQKEKYSWTKRFLTNSIESNANSSENVTQERPLQKSLWEMLKDQESSST